MIRTAGSTRAFGLGTVEGATVNRTSMSKQVSEPGLYANINAKKKRIAAGSGEKMRKPGDKGAPTAKAFKQSAKTARRTK